MFWVVATASVAALVLLARHSSGAAGLAALVAAGAMLAALTNRSSDRCTQLLRAQTDWTVVFPEDAAPGDFLVVEVGAGGCRGRAALAISSGRARGGEIAAVRGIAQASDRGLIIQRGEIQRVQGRSHLLALRTASGHAIDALFGQRAGMVRALLIADSHGIPPDVRDRYADAGLVHMLSISGLHVGIIAGATQLLLLAFRLPVAGATLTSALITALYIVMIGAPAAAVRSGAMLFVAAASQILQRPSSPWAALAIGALVPLLHPETALSLGYQLSVTGMAGLICAGIFARRYLPRSGWRAALTTSVAATVLASLATAPIIAWHFGRISVIAPITNLLAAPLMVVLQPLLFLALLLSPLPWLAQFMADASAPLLDLFDQIARRGAEFGWSAVDVAPSLFTVLLTGTAVLGVLLCSVSRRPARYLIFSAAAACVIVWAPVLPLHPVGGVLEVHLVDVGQGDAIAVKLPDGRWILFDAGRAWRGGDAGRRTLIPYIRRHGGELYAFVLSHPHSDHVGGAESVIRWLRPRIFWDAAYVAANDDYLAALRVSRENGVDWRRVRPGYTVEAGGAKLEFLAPDSAWTASLDDANEASTVVMLRYGDISLLLTGDAEREEEAWLAARYGARLRATVLKVGHHGSNTSTTEGFLRLVQPRIALVSVGRGNRYGHPSESVLQSLASAGAVVVRTDRHGTAVLSTDGRGLWLEALGERWKVQ